MPLVFAGEKRIFFAHVPKTGGTSVEDYLIERFGNICMLNRRWSDQTRRSGNLRKGVGLIVPPQHLAAADLKELLPERIDYSFAVVRDPVKRMISEYNFHQPGIGGMPISFSLWLRLVLGACRRCPTVLENHIRPQTDLTPEDCEIFRLEDGFESLRLRLDDICGDTAPQIDFPHKLISEKRRAVTPSPSDLALIAVAYAADYARFGYTTPDIAGAGPSLKDAGLNLLARLGAPAVVARYHRGN